MEDVPLYPFFGAERLLVFARDYEAGSTQEWHQHDVPQLLHAARGVMRMSTPDGYWVVPPGRGVWIPAFVPHSIGMVGSVSMRTLYVGGATGHPEPPVCAVVEVSAMLQRLLEELAAPDVAADQERRRRLAMEELVLIEVARLPRLALRVPLPTDPRLRRLCDAVIAAPDNTSLEVLADRFGASARTVRRLFRDELGMSFAAWREQARMVEALARLEEGRSISTVSRELGYAAPSAFTAMFKRILGQSPRDYQRRR